jgi:hypothetical protein
VQPGIVGKRIATMKLSSGWPNFHAKLNRHYPRFGAPTQIDFDFGEDEGTGL